MDPSQMADPFPGSESSVHANMANMSYANSSPAATTAGQGSNPVSESVPIPSTTPFCPIFMIFITSLSPAYLPLPEFISDHAGAWHRLIRAPHPYRAHQISPNLIIVHPPHPISSSSFLPNTLSIPHDGDYFD